MCGIIGLINITNSDEIVKEVSLTQRHRGPDAQDYWNNKRIYFSHQRLSIIDTKKIGSAHEKKWPCNNIQW